MLWEKKDFLLLMEITFPKENNDFYSFFFLPFFFFFHAFNKLTTQQELTTTQREAYFNGMKREEWVAPIPGLP